MFKQWTKGVDNGALNCVRMDFKIAKYRNSKFSIQYTESIELRSPD